MVRPAASRPMNAAMVQIGTPMTPTSVALPDLRNRNITPVASNAPKIRFCQTLATEA